MTEPLAVGSVHAIVDGGLDDALALGVLVGLGVPLTQVIATTGSVDLLTTATATGRLMATLRSAVPVRLGLDRGCPLRTPMGEIPFMAPTRSAGRLTH